MSEIESYTFRNQNVRTVQLDRETAFVHADVCAVLELGNPSDVLRRLDDDERGVASIDGPNGRSMTVNVLTESGLYSLILGSRKPQARPFKRWVTHEVLPQIRATGSYSTPRADLALATPREQLLALAAGLIDAENRTAEVTEERDVIAAALESATPAIAYHERYVCDDDVLLIKAWGAQFGLTDPEARDLLVQKNIIYRLFIGDRWSETQKRKIPEYEWRARAGRVTFAWFDLRPQHNVGRLHNGQVRQTLYIRQRFALELGHKVGLTTTNAVEIAGDAA